MTLKKSFIDDMFERLQRSPNPKERTATFIGFDNDRERAPILFPNASWKESFWVLGAARSGKTSRALTPITAQRIRRNDCPIVIIDLKADDAFFHVARLEAKHVGRPFYWFTNIDTRSTYLFNPLSQGHLEKLTPAQFAEVVINAMGLWHGFRYGGSYFSFQSISALSDALNLTPNETHNGWSFLRNAEGLRPAETFSELEENVRKVCRDKKEYAGAAALLMCLRKMASILQLNFSSQGSRLPQTAINAAIQIPKILLPDENGNFAVTYLHLRSSTGFVECSLVGKVFATGVYHGLISLRDAFKAGVLKDAPRETMIVIDEFQNICDDAIKPMLHAGGSAGMQFVLANQDISQLREISPNLFDDVWENSGSRLVFTARLDELQKLIMSLSGEKRIDYIKAFQQHSLLRGVGPEFADEGYTMTSSPGPRFERNDVIRTSARQGHAFFFPPSNEEFAEYDGFPMRVICPHLFGPEVFAAIERLPWPTKTPETIVPCEHREDGYDPFSYIPEHCRV